MKTWHWYSMAIVLIVAYLVGVKYPSFGQAALAKVGM